MDGIARHYGKTTTFGLSQGLVPNLEDRKKGRHGYAPSQICDKGKTPFFDLNFPILPRAELFEEDGAGRWETLAQLTKGALDELGRAKTQLSGASGEMRFFGQLQRLHRIMPGGVLKEFETGNGEIGIAVFKPMHGTSEVWAIPMAPIFSLRKRSPKLFTALLSFIDGLPFDNMFNRSGYILECLMDWNFEVNLENGDTKECCSEGECMACFIGRLAPFFWENSQGDWMGILKDYRPRKPLYKEIKALLLDAPCIDFNAFANLCFLDGDTDLRAHDLVVFIDHQNSQLEGAYLSFINEIAQHTYSHTLYDVAVVKKEGVQGFGFEGKEKMMEVLSFMEKLNELILRL